MVISLPWIAEVVYVVFWKCARPFSSGGEPMAESRNKK